MLENFLQRSAADALSSQSHPPGDPLAPPQDKSDPRIDEVRRGYRTRCWIWRDAATADAARARVWQETYKRSSDDALVSLCGHPHCIRASHLQRIAPADQRTLSQILQYAGGGREGVARVGGLIQSLSWQLNWDHREWMGLLNVTEYSYKQGIADYEAQDAAIRAGAAARQSVAPATEPASPNDVEPAETVAPPPALSQPADAPPAMPSLLKKAGPLGQPANLTAQPGRAPGQVDLAWTPAVNAALQIVVVVMPGASESAAHPQALWGSDSAVTLAEMAAGLWHFAILAGHSPAPDSNQFTWSEPSNWAAIEIS